MTEEEKIQYIEAFKKLLEEDIAEIEVHRISVDERGNYTSRVVIRIVKE